MACQNVIRQMPLISIDQNKFSVLLFSVQTLNDTIWGQHSVAVNVSPS